MGPKAEILELLPVHNWKKKKKREKKVWPDPGSHRTERGKGKWCYSNSWSLLSIFSVQSLSWYCVSPSKAILLAQAEFHFWATTPSQQICLENSAFKCPCGHQQATGPGVKNPSHADTSWTNSHIYSSDVSIASENEGWSAAQSEGSLSVPRQVSHRKTWAKQKPALGRFTLLQDQIPW